MIGLDVGLVLTHGDKGWHVAARASRDEDGDGPPSAGREFSQTVLAQVLASKQTFYQDLALMRSPGEPARAWTPWWPRRFSAWRTRWWGRCTACGAARGRTKGVKIRPLEAQLVQLLAAAAGANLARTVATRHAHPVRAVLLPGAGARAGARPEACWRAAVRK